MLKTTVTKIILAKYVAPPAMINFVAELYARNDKPTASVNDTTATPRNRAGSTDS
jgi:hypothetical protein